MSAPIVEQPQLAPSSGPWYRELNGYHWFVFIVCTLGWMFDCLDQQLFNLARPQAMATLLGVPETSPEVARLGGYATSVMLIGWATGGIIFGIMGDKFGRAKTMVWTILFYSVFTGLSSLSTTFWDFLAYRFLTGLGVGGQFAVGVALVAETMPERARPKALGMLQALSAAGNVGAALIGLGLSQLENMEVIAGARWRWMFGVGILPGLLAVVVMSRLKEPEKWRAAVATGAGRAKAGSLTELFGAQWRGRIILGMALAAVGVIGLWGIGVFTADLNRMTFNRREKAEYRKAEHTAVDRQLVQAVIAHPAALEALAKPNPKAAEKPIKELVAPVMLLAEAEKPDAAKGTFGDRDPSALYTAALALHKEGKPVSQEAVLALLDKGDEGLKLKPQKPEDRARREAYLAGAAVSAEAAPKLAGQIAERSKGISLRVNRWADLSLMLFNIGAFFGMYVFSMVTERIGRRPTFAIFFALAMVTTAMTFMFMKEPTDVFWMVPLMGACQLAVFGGYAIYLPELFPTRLRSTSVSFCYNIGRFAAAAGPAALGFMTSAIFTEQRGFAEPMRWAGLAMCSIFVFGIIVVWFGPETKGKPLPE